MFASNCAVDVMLITSERSPWGRATDLRLARAFAAAWADWLYLAERKGRIYLANA